ncbi:ZIP zinc transporter [Elsinoe australis]|uniref:ZIP zinc transporter n=1 Tax=Elsinoe australis TaxID=40998 RepID=A0A4U7AXQ3_9PEZI|nr:ZIP zinc transporter [Elsinoe australis]
MAFKLSLLLAGSYAAGALGQTFIVSACSTVSGQQVCQGPSGTPVTFTNSASASASATPSSAPVTSAPASTSASATTSSAGMSVTAISQCHYHGTSPYCFVGTAEYEILDAPTRTEELPAQYTGCHSHGSEMFCVSPSGEDVAVRAEGASAEGGSHGGEDDHDHGSSGTPSSTVSGSTGSSSPSTGGSSGAVSCHFHGGVEHCVPEGGSESGVERSCDRQTREYNIPLRVGMLFVVLVTSSIAVFTPILMSSILKNKIVSFVLLQLKQFGTGVLVSTAFVHLYTHAELMLTNECITWPERYEGTTAAIVMAGIFLSFLVEYIGSRIIMRMYVKRDGNETASQSRDSGADSGEENSKSTAEASLAHVGHGLHDHAGTFFMHPQQQKLSVMVVEAGIIFHSILIGLTLIVAGDSVFGSLVVVIIFHQMFEGIALGTRIAELPTASTDGTAPVSKLTKYLFGGLFAIITPIGMGIGIGVLDSWNGNEPSTLIAIGVLDAISAGILAWVALVEMWAGDWLHGPLARARLSIAAPSIASLMFGMLIMSVLGKWA